MYANGASDRRGCKQAFHASISPGPAAIVPREPVVYRKRGYGIETPNSNLKGRRGRVRCPAGRKPPKSESGGGEVA